MKLIMIDLDGTLFDTKDVNYFAYKEAIEIYGYTIDYEYYCKYCNGRHYMDFLPKITTTDETVLNNMHNRKKIAYSKYLDKAVANKNLINIIKNCKKEYKVALVTTASKKNTDEILEKFELQWLFDLIITQENIIKPKPDPDGFLQAMSFFDAEPQDSIIFEDSIVGIEAAKKTGASVFVVKGYN